MQKHIVKNVKFIAQKTGQRYPGTLYPHRELANSPTPGSKVWWGHPGADLVWGIFNVGEDVMGGSKTIPGKKS